MSTKWAKFSTKWKIPVIIIVSTILSISCSFFSSLIVLMVILNHPNNNISNFEGKNRRYILNTFTFRNQSLYRYHSDIIISDEEEEPEFGKFSTQSFGYNRNDNFVISVSPHIGNEFSVQCEGVCNCYEEDIHNERKLGSLVYSSRYVSIVVVSILSFAAAKFVDSHVNDCYDQVKRYLDKYDATSSSSSMITCSIDKVDCNLNEAIEETKKRKDVLILRVFECTGHCKQRRATKAKYNSREALNALNSINCENKILGPKIIEITENDNIRKRAIGEATYYRFNEAARIKFRSLFLVLFCKSFRVKYTYFNPNHNGCAQMITIIPCSASWNTKIGQVFSNIKCKAVD